MPSARIDYFQAHVSTRKNMLEQNSKKGTNKVPFSVCSPRRTGRLIIVCEVTRGAAFGQQLGAKKCIESENNGVRGV